VTITQPARPSGCKLQTGSDLAAADAPA
jgi:hypothetical protein